MVGVRLCVRDVSRILSDRILDRGHSEHDARHQPNYCGAYGEAVSNTQNLQVNVNAGDCPRCDGGILIEEVPEIALDMD